MKHLYIIALLFLSLACSKDGDSYTPPPLESKQTILFYMPWSTNLTSFFRQNIEDMKITLKAEASSDERIVVFFASSSSKATLTEYRYYNGDVQENMLKSYDISTFTTSDGIASLMKDMKHYTPASRYAMVVSCHGMGWLPVDDTKSLGNDLKPYWEYEGIPITRYFGGLSPQYQIDVNTFAEGIKASNTKFEYLLFDVCYMSNIESIYDLKDVSDYIIASPTEILGEGFPYDDIGRDMLGDVNYKGIIDGFYNFYSHFFRPYGTISLIDCSEIDNMREVMSNITSLYDTSAINRLSLQRMDGYSPIIFYDFGSYIESFCDNKTILTSFNDALAKLIPYSQHTARFYSMSMGSVAIKKYSGITTSAPSLNQSAIEVINTNWYRDCY